MVEQWEREAEVRALGDPEPMPVRWTLADPTVMDHPHLIAPQGLHFTGRSDQMPAMTEEFRRLDRRRLVITGEPGSGKTTLAVQLLLELLTDPRPGEPVPVLFSVVGWDPQTQPRLEDWLTDRFKQDYPGLRGFGIDTAEALFRRGHLLPILDGLDEVTQHRRGEIITALNASLGPTIGLVLTSRSIEYTDAVRTSDVLTTAAVIHAEPLSPEQSTTYLRHHLPPHPNHAAWLDVLAHLQDGTAPELTAVTASPLGLWLVRTVYVNGRLEPTPLIQDTHPDRAGHATLQAHLLDRLIPAVIYNRPTDLRRRTGGCTRMPLQPRREHDPGDMRRWLTTLAEELQDAGTKDWIWWYLARHTFPTTLTLFIARLTLGLAVGLAGGLVSGLLAVLAGGLTGGLRFGLAGGLVSGLTFSLAGELDAVPKHIGMRFKRRTPKLLRSLVIGMVVGLLAVVFVVMMVLMLAAISVVMRAAELMDSPAGGELADGLALMLVGMLSLGLIFGSLGGPVRRLRSYLANASVAQRATSPLSSYRGDRLQIGIQCLVLGLVFGLLFGLSTGLMFGPTGGLLGGLAGGLVLGFRKGAWPAFLLASAWLVVRRRFPWRPMAFLDDAYRLGLLHVVGSAYQFRHAELQDHLAPPRPAQEKDV
ncbi:MAG: NACHT domain-containing protein [Pseudonocardia sp.]